MDEINESRDLYEIVFSCFVFDKYLPNTIKYLQMSLEAILESHSRTCTEVDWIVAVTELDRTSRSRKALYNSLRWLFRDCRISGINSSELASSDSSFIR